MKVDKKRHVKSAEKVTNCKMSFKVKYRAIFVFVVIVFIMYIFLNLCQYAQRQTSIVGVSSPLSYLLINNSRVETICGNEKSSEVNTASKSCDPLGIVGNGIALMDMTNDGLVFYYESKNDANMTLIQVDQRLSANGWIKCEDAQNSRLSYAYYGANGCNTILSGGVYDAIDGCSVVVQLL